MTNEGGLMPASRYVVFVFALCTVATTFVLLCSGGLVTSHGAGMAVPDWPTTYGYNMFLFPVSRWIGGVFYEHTHRLIASGLGMMTVILAVLLLKFESRRWVRYMGLIAVVAVILQGVLGGLRVTLIKNEIGIFHALLAQSFFLFVGIIAMVVSPWFHRQHWSNDQFACKFRWLALAAVGAIFFQLGSAAAMRHAHADLSIPDFPLAYGKWWPPTDHESLEKINALRLQEVKPPTTSFLILLHMAHRLGALTAVALIVIFTVVVLRGVGIPKGIRFWALVWSLLVAAQFFLGAWTIWSNKAADVATAHMALGALLFFLGGMLTFRLFYAKSAYLKERVVEDAIWDRRTIS